MALAIATGALVALTSGATAFVVLTGTSAVVGPQVELEPRPPVAAPPAQLPFVELPPDAALAGPSPRRPVSVAGPARPPRQPAARPLVGPVVPAELVPVLLPFSGPDLVDPVVPDPEEPVFGPRVPVLEPADPEVDLPRAVPASPAKAGKPGHAGPKTKAATSKAAPPKAKPSKAKPSKKASKPSKKGKASKAPQSARNAQHPGSGRGGHRLR